MNRLLPARGDLAGGLTACLVALPVCLAYAPIVFAAAGPAHLPAAVVSMLATVAALNLAGALLGSPRVMIGVTDGPTALMLGAGLASFVSATRAGGRPADLPLALALLSLAALLSGLLQVALGRLHAGRLAKYIPFPVVAGLRNGTALLILLHQARPLLGLPAAAAGPGAGGAAAILPAAALVGALTFAVTVLAERRRAPLPAPLLGLLSGTILHHALEAACGAAVSGARVGISDAAAPFRPPLLLLADPAFAARTPSGLLAALLPDALLLALGLATLAALQTVLTVAALDAVDETRTSSDPEIVACGLGTIASAAIGGIAGAPLATPSLACRAAGGGRPAARAIAALFSLLLLASGAAVIGLVPKAALAGVVVSLCLALIDRRSLRGLLDLLRGRREARQEAADLAIVASVAATLLVFGILAAVAFGILVSILHFARRMERGNVRRHFSAAQIHSNVHRNAGEFSILTSEGGQIQALELEGALFFATADRLARRIEQVASGGARHLLLDFSRVGEIDATALDILDREARRLAKAGIELSACGLPGASRSGRRISAGSVGERIGPERIFADLDEALAHAEDRLLDAAIGRDRRSRATPFRDFPLFAQCTAEELDELEPLFRRREYPEGAHLARAGDPPDRLHLLSCGRVEVRIACPGDGASRRIGALTGGSVLGEMALLDGRPRSADLLATAYCLCFEVTSADLERLRAERPGLAYKILAGLARELAHRLRISNHLITGLKA